MHIESIASAPRLAAPSIDLRRIAGWLRVALVLAFFAFWIVCLRPQALGGPAGYALVAGTSMEPTMHTGDVVIVHAQPHYGVGDVIAYRVPEGQAGAGAQVIHRIIGGNERTGFVVQGDNRTAPDVWHPRHAEIVGSEWAHVPKLGMLVMLLHTPLFLASMAAGVAVSCAIGGSGRLQ
jgi:signal peptidase I